MDTLNLIEKILFVFTDNIWIFYLAVCLRQQVRMKAVSVREMTFLALLDKATSYVVLALMSGLGVFLAMRRRQAVTADCRRYAVCHGVDVADKVSGHSFL